MIAVLSRSVEFALGWITRNNVVKEIHQSQKRVILADGTELRIITRIEDALGYEFDSYVKAPDYDYLEEFIKTRTKNELHRHLLKVP